MDKYKHTQIGYVLIIAFSAAMLLIISLMFTTADFNLVPIFVLGFMILCLALFATLAVEVDEQSINLRFGVGVIRKRFMLQDIEAYRAVKNPWYYGWGIHVIPHGWIFNVSGWDAVELQMKNGRKYRIGSDDAAGLVNALETHLQKT
ncbi:MAG TPA: hypothetical protein VHP14_18555 [Anaerolineales bacterium]|nr:hypothetical protein [Anaerolineales bacterium]